MNKNRDIVTYCDFNLQLFAEGEEADGVIDSPAGEEVNKSSNPVEQPLVVYGKQEEDFDSSDNETDDQNAETSQNDGDSEIPKTEVDNKKSWEQIKNDPKYRKMYDDEVQGIVKSRIKDYKQLEQKVVHFDEVIEILSDKYNTKDISEVINQLRKDYYEAEAYDKGIENPENYAEIEILKKENAKLKMEHENEFKKQQMNAKIENWIEQSKKMMETYPQFDLRVEVNNNPQFLKLLEAGIEVKTAFELTNPNAIEEAKKVIAKETEKKVLDKIKGRQARPSENGLENGTGKSVIAKKSVLDLNKEDRLDIRKRVARGEKIRF